MNSIQQHFLKAVTEHHFDTLKPIFLTSKQKFLLHFVKFNDSLATVNTETLRLKLKYLLSLFKAVSKSSIK